MSDETTLALGVDPSRMIGKLFAYDTIEERRMIWDPQAVVWVTPDPLVDRNILITAYDSSIKCGVNVSVPENALVRAIKAARRS